MIKSGFSDVPPVVSIPLSRQLGPGENQLSEIPNHLARRKRRILALGERKIPNAFVSGAKNVELISRRESGRRKIYKTRQPVISKLFPIADFQRGHTGHRRTPKR
ncbi:hypothetical protein [Rhizobium mayense]|uniref:Uncharacterized protein n=1 Tax=Rhizobium mayense TaxID=1312184 RepID=A0ABT7K3A6_9HYPH|nr:hypothetical protein [Rhizobium mayense]MDL2402485.1 hypothetical protein [Rhizobium mayense]